MDKIKLDAGDLLIIDPCYIKHVEDERYDMLKLEKVVYEGSDGLIGVSIDGLPIELGVDSGRIWAMRAEFNGEVEVDAGLSGYHVIESLKDASVIEAM